MTIVDAETKDHDLLITRTFDAPRGRVFKAWTDRTDLLRWGAPHGFTVTECEGDARPGGTWRACMRSPDGIDHRNGGVYREVVAPERLVYTFAWDDAEGRRGHETIVTVRFAERDGTTDMTFRQGSFESAADRDGHADGWGQAFEQLAKVVDGHRSGAKSAKVS